MTTALAATPMWQPACNRTRVTNVETPRAKPAAASTGRRNGILLALAAAWMIVSLAIGGAVAADPNTGQATPTQQAADEAANR